MNNKVYDLTKEYTTSKTQLDAQRQNITLTSEAKHVQSLPDMTSQASEFKTVGHQSEINVDNGKK